MNLAAVEPTLLKLFGSRTNHPARALAVMISPAYTHVDQLATWLYGMIRSSLFGSIVLDRVTKHRNGRDGVKYREIERTRMVMEPEDDGPTFRVTKTRWASNTFSPQEAPKITPLGMPLPTNLSGLLLPVCCHAVLLGCSKNAGTCSHKEYR